MGFIVTFSYMYRTYFDHIHPNCPLLSPFPLLLVPFFFPNSPSFAFMSFLKNLDSTHERKYAIFIFPSLTTLA
jgi:hypothetical protein